MSSSSLRIYGCQKISASESNCLLSKKKALRFPDVFCLSSVFVFAILASVLAWARHDKEVTRLVCVFLLLVFCTWRHAVAVANAHLRSNIRYEKSQGTEERINCRLKKASSQSTH